MAHTHTHNDDVAKKKCLNFTLNPVKIKFSRTSQSFMKTFRSKNYNNNNNNQKSDVINYAKVFAFLFILVEIRTFSNTVFVNVI